MRLVLWPDFRRLVASLMLVAVTAFVLHGAAMAKAEAGKSGGLGTVEHVYHVADGVDHQHLAADHDHADAGDQSDHHHGKGGSSGACCGSMCAFALPASALVHAVFLAMVSVVLTAAADLWSGLDPSGLKRPPRPLFSA